MNAESAVTLVNSICYMIGQFSFFSHYSQKNAGLFLDEMLTVPRLVMDCQHGFYWLAQGYFSQFSCFPLYLTITSFVLKWKYDLVVLWLVGQQLACSN